MPKEKSTKNIVTDVIDGLQKLYDAKMKPVEELYLMSKFGEPTLKPADIAAKPFVMFLGQYSTGKTTFIKYSFLFLFFISSFPFSFFLFPFFVLEF